MKLKATIHKILLVLFLVALAAWDTSCTSSTQQETTQQQATQQQKTQQQETTQQQKTQQRATQQQKTQQQETTQQVAQATPSTTQSSDLAAPLIGIWGATSILGNSVPPGTQVLTFSDDGTFRSTTYSNGSPTDDSTAQYSVLDDSHIQFTAPDGTSAVGDYSLDNDTLTLAYQGVTSTYQRTG